MLSRRQTSIVFAFTLSCSRHETSAPTGESVPSSNAVATPPVPTAAKLEMPTGIAPSRAQPKPSNPSRPIEVALRYACDEKYGSAGIECAPSSEPFRRWCSTVTFSPSPDPRVEPSGGGPLGAAWNPSNDLVLFVSTSEAPESVHVGREIIKTSNAAGHAWLAFRVPQRDWKRVERPLRESDGLGWGADDGPRTSVVTMDLWLADGRRRPVYMLTGYGE